MNIAQHLIPDAFHFLDHLIGFCHHFFGGFGVRLFHLLSARAFFSLLLQFLQDVDQFSYFFRLLGVLLRELLHLDD